jgi:hypothetical protein
VAGHGGARNFNVPTGNVEPATSADIGLSHKEVFDARRIRDAEQTNPGIVKRAIDGMLDRGEEPTRAALKREIAPAIDDDFEGHTDVSAQSAGDDEPPMQSGTTASNEAKIVNRTSFTGNNGIEQMLRRWWLEKTRSRLERLSSRQYKRREPPRVPAPRRIRPRACAQPALRSPARPPSADEPMPRDRRERLGFREASGARTRVNCSPAAAACPSRRRLSPATCRAA